MNQQLTGYYHYSGFPNVLGCLDGTQVRIQAPHQNEMEYVCRKGFHALNIQVSALERYTNIQVWENIKMT